MPWIHIFNILILVNFQYGNGQRFVGQSCKIFYDISPISVICNVTSGDTWRLDNFRELMNGTKKSYLGDDQYTLKIECHGGGNISIRQPIKLPGMTSLTVRNCYITDYYDYDFSQEVSSIESVLQNLKFTNCKIEYRSLVHINHVQKNYKKLLAYEKCQISNTLRTFIFQNSSIDYYNPKRPYTRKEKKLKLDYDNELKLDYYNELRLLRKCAHNNLTYVEISSLGRIPAEVTINNLLQNGIFNSLSVINLTKNGLKRVPSSLFTDSMYQTIDRLSNIDLSRNNIEDISFLYMYYDFDGNLNVDLTGNRITELSNLDTNKLKSFSGFRNKINLRENPLKCTCYQKLFYEFIAKINDKEMSQYTYLKSMQCLDQESDRNSKNISEFSFKGMCKKTHSVVCVKEGISEIYKCSFIGFSLVFLTIVFTCLISKYKYKIKQLYRVKTTDQCHCPDNPKCYDAFISYSSSDERWVYDVLCTKLKSLLPDINLCLHHKDFIPGACIAENIINSVENSRYTLLILSLNFIESEWCQMEFQKAFHQTLKHRRHLLVLLIEDIDFSLLDYDLRFFLQTYTYLKYSEKLFWQKLAGTLQMSRDEAKTLSHSTNQVFNQLLPPDYDSCV
ncbi:toll-like receptor Tollo [Mytilus trossulus]|uniref:toll-like receptor Tollo n=1 Tax=Mytilus trossulus TaxID=6551 RepID=UPI0030066E34